MAFGDNQLPTARCRFADFVLNPSPDRYTLAYVYDPTGRLVRMDWDGVQQITNVSYAYNANGDLLNDGLHSFSYNAEGRLSDATTGATDTSPTTRYAYNALGQRVFKTEPLYPPAAGDENDPGFMQTLIDFFMNLWNPGPVEAERLGYAYGYDEDGNLIGEFGMGGPNSTGQAAYLWLPTANGALPVMMANGTSRFAIHADHLNTPRMLTAWDGSLAWQWTYSAFGDTQPTIAGHKFAQAAPVLGDFEFNLRYPGQVADKESGLNYNYFRSYSPTTGRYTQPDPIGLDGGWNRLGYVDANPLSFVDPSGLDRWGTYGYGRYIPATNPSPSLLEMLHFNESPEQREIAENIALGFCGSTIGGAAREGALWSATKVKSALRNALDHWNKHGTEFPELANAKQYVESARDLAANPPATALTKARGADSLVYDPATNTFVSSGPNGAPRTMFRPRDGIDYWNRQ